MTTTTTSPSTVVAPASYEALVAWLAQQGWSDFAVSLARQAKPNRRLSDGQITSATNMFVKCVSKFAQPVADLANRLNDLHDANPAAFTADVLATAGALMADVTAVCNEGNRDLAAATTAALTTLVATVTGETVAAPAPTGIDISNLPTGHYAVPNGDTRLKVSVRNVTTGKWAGWVFVSDGAAYGQQTKYGSQRPGQRYVGKISEALAVIAADPQAALAAYASITGECGLCRKALEDAVSVSRGVGPVCVRKVEGWVDSPETLALLAEAKVAKRSA
jgi:hypothetical protein